MKVSHKKSFNRPLRGNETGLVAIMVTMIIMALLTLVTIGFSRLMLREQRQALDRQLGAQAFYAAESGINDAIRSGVAAKNDCTELPTANGAGTYDHELSAADFVSYSCVTIDAGGGNVVFDSVSANESTTFPINSGDIDELTFSWQDVGDNAIFTEADANFPRMPQLNTWGDTTGILRVTLVPVPATGFDRATMQSLARTYYLYPSTIGSHNPKSLVYDAGGNIAPGYWTGAGSENSNGQVVSGQCSAANTPRFCNVTIDNLGSSGAARYYVRIKAIYRDVKVTIQGQNSAGNDIPLPGAQYVIDSTGKANDVLKRIQVRIPLNNSYIWPEYVVDSASTICKRLVVNPGSAQNSDCREPFPVNMNNDPLGLD